MLVNKRLIHSYLLKILGSFCEATEKDFVFVTR